MRILFLCGSLEPGRDGVGDYTRSLAEACSAQGHPCAAISLNDPYVTEPVQAEGPQAGANWPTLRLPKILPWRKRACLVTAFRDQFRPDWISLQFVGYGLNDKGIVSSLVPHFQSMLAGCRVHIMFHELWVGMPAGAPFKHWIAGALQRRGIRRLCRAVKPQVVTTSNPLYVEALRRAGVAASLLPLYGNIPVVDRGHETAFPGWLGDLGITAANRSEWWLGLFFGGLYFDWKAEPFVSLLTRAAKKAGKRVCLLSVGRLGAEGKEVWQQMQSGYSGISFPALGEQPAEVVSILMQVSDFGVAASPWALIGKSGSAAAMVEHGLPVIVTREDGQSRFSVPAPPSTDPLFHRLDDTLESKFIEGLPHGVPQARRDGIARQFCALLQQNS